MANAYISSCNCTEQPKRATESELYFQVHTAVNTVALAAPNAAATKVISLFQQNAGST